MAMAETERDRNKKTVAVYESDWERLGNLARAGESLADAQERLLDEREEARSEAEQLRQRVQELEADESA